MHILVYTIILGLVYYVFFIRKIYPDDPKKFKIEVRESWFSEDYVEYWYTGNGVNWKKVKCFHEPTLDWREHDAYMDAISHSMPRGSDDPDKNYFAAELHRWGSLEKIKAYEAEELKKSKRGK